MRSLEPRPIKFVRSSALLFLLLSAATVRADGGFSGLTNVTTKTDTVTDTSPTGAPTAATEAAAINFSQAGVSFTAITAAIAETAGTAVIAGAGDVTNVQFPSNAQVTVDSNSTVSTEFMKGGNSLGQARSDTTVTVYINGKPYAVATEVAMAVARITAQGASSSTATATGTLSTVGDITTAGPVVVSKPVR